MVNQEARQPNRFTVLLGRRLRRLAGDDGASAAVEFAMLAPVLFFILFGIVSFGLVFNNYVELTNATRASARQFAIARSSTTPYANATGAITSSAPDLTPANVTMTFTVNGTTCASNTACQTALSTAEGESAEVTATYPCNLTIMGVNFANNCTLSAQTTELVE